MKKLLFAAWLALCLPQVAQAQLPPNYLGRSGAVTQEVCISPTVTASAYGAGNSLGGLITFPSAFLIAGSGILQSIRLDFKSVQTVEFDVTFLSGLPVTTFTDHATPALNAADFGLVQPVIKMTNNYSGFGTHTVYGADNIIRGVKVAGGTSAYAVITTPGTPTLASTSDVQLCATWRDD